MAKSSARHRAKLKARNTKARVRRCGYMRVTRKGGRLKRVGARHKQTVD